MDLAHLKIWQSYLRELDTDDFDSFLIGCEIVSEPPLPLTAVNLDGSVDPDRYSPNYVPPYEKRVVAGYQLKMICAGEFD